MQPIFTACTREEYDAIPHYRCTVRGRVEVKYGGNVVAVRERNEYSAKTCKTAKEAERLYRAILYR